MAGKATLQVDIIADAKGVKRGTDEASKGFGRLGGVMGKLGPLAAAGGAAVAAAAGAMAVASIKSASDMEQSLGAVETIFGKSASAVAEYAATSADRLGLAKSEYNTLAASIGTSMKNMGKSQAQAAVDTDMLVGRAADLAATFGGSTSDAVSALGAAFRGEFDSVERLGISLKASDISAELASRGQAKLAGQALKNAQGQATLDLIMKQTAQTQGAFGRESDTLAGQQARLGAKFEDLKATLGAKLIPILVKAAQWVQQSLGPALQRLAAWVQVNVVPALRQMAATVGTNLMPHIRKLGSWVQANLVPALQKLGTFITKVILPAFQGWVSFITGKVWPVIANLLAPVVRSITAAVKNLAGKVAENQGQFAKLVPFFKKLWEGINAAMPYVQKFASFLGSVLGAAISGVSAVIGGAVGAIAGLIGWIDAAINKIGALVGKITGPLSSAASTVGNVIGKIPGFSAVVHPMTASPLAGPVTGLLTASVGDPFAWSTGAGAGRTSYRVSPGATINMPITINGALDPVAVARQLEGVLRDAATRLGRQPTLGWA